jgi:hypothetical protein
VVAPPKAKPAEAVAPTTTPAPDKPATPPRVKQQPRLSRPPNGATFHVVYDAEAVKWSGTLTIPAPRSGTFKESVVSADDGAVFALLQRLDRKFRGMEEESAAESPAETNAQPSPWYVAGETIFS